MEYFQRCVYTVPGPDWTPQSGATRLSPDGLYRRRLDRVQPRDPAHLLRRGREPEVDDQILPEGCSNGPRLARAVTGCDCTSLGMGGRGVPGS